MKPQRRASALLLPLAVCAGIYLIGLAVPKITGKSTFWIFLPGFFTESIFLLCSLALSAWLTKGHMAAFGFTKGTFRLTPRFFLWLLPMLVIATLQVVGSPAGESPNAGESIGTPIGVILTIWIYASICEEVLTHGLLQSWLSALTQYRVRLGRWAVSTPVLTSALFFAAMHVVLWPKLGPVALVVILLTGILGVIAGYYREKTGSLIPAILVHSLFDIGGTLPPWISVWLHHGHV
jgi:membrane protease YdiL (CAAX protease family)